MDTRILQYYLTVAREENITKAAELLHITQPTLSRQLAKLEEDFGIQLFVRGKSGITLTEEGRLLRRRAEDILALCEKAERELTSQKDAIGGTISIGGGELAAIKLLPRLCQSFREKYPGAAFDLYTGNADLIKERLDSGLTDIGILLEPVDISKYSFIRFHIKERWVAVMRADSPLAQQSVVTAEALSALPLIMPKRQPLLSEIESWFGVYADRMNIAVTSAMSTNASIFVERGFGTAPVIEGSLPFLDNTKLCCRPLYPEMATTSVMAWKKDRTLAPVVKRFIDHIAAAF